MDDGRGLQFGTVAENYDRFRPSPPPEAAALLAELEGRDVLEVGAGTGKFTRFLVALGAKVSIIEPDDDMRRVAVRRSPEVLELLGRAEAVPASDATYDALLCASAWHWFQQPEATDEFARVLRDDATLYVVWNGFSRDVDWMVALTTLRERPGDAGKRPRGWRVRFTPEQPFVDERDVELHWSWTRSVDEVVALFSTYSGSIIQSDAWRQSMATTVRASLVDRFGDGEVELPMTLRGTIARRRPR